MLSICGSRLGGKNSVWWNDVKAEVEILGASDEIGKSM